MEKVISEKYLTALFEIWDEIGEFSTSTVTGNCMSPVIREGDSLVMHHGAKEIRVGDVIVFGAPGEFYVTRVIKRERKGEKEFFLLKSDQSTDFCEPATRNQILGKVIEVRGAKGALHLNSSFWKCLNYILSIRSYIHGKRFSAGSSFWRGIHSLYSLKNSLFPKRGSSEPILWKGICGTYRVWSRVEKFVQSPKRRYG